MMMHDTQICTEAFSSARRRRVRRVPGRVRVVRVRVSAVLRGHSDQAVGRGGGGVRRVRGVLQVLCDHRAVLWVRDLSNMSDDR